MTGVFMGFYAHLCAKFQVLGSDSQFQVLSSKFRVISDSKLGTRHSELGTAVRGGRRPSFDLDRDRFSLGVLRLRQGNLQDTVLKGSLDLVTCHRRRQG